MSTNERRVKAREAFMHLAAEFLKEESNRTSLITVTGASLSPSMLHGTIYVTVFPETDEKHALQFLGRQKDNFREFLKDHIKSRAIPNFAFQIDPLEKDRIHLDETLRNAGKKA